MADRIFADYRNKIAVFLIILLTALAYANSLQNSFVLDDARVIINNDFIRSRSNLSAIFTRSHPDLFKDNPADPSAGPPQTPCRLIATLSYSIDFYFWRLNPFGYHLTNLLLHIFNSVLLYYFASLITGDRKTGLFSALLFALHPVNTEAVNAISFRSDLLAFLFFLSALNVYAVIDRHSGNKKDLFYAFALLLFSLALFSKEMAVTLPFMIILYDLFFGFQQTPKSFFIKLKSRYPGFFGILLFYIWIRFLVVRDLTVAPAAYPGGNFYTNILTMCGVVAAYLKLIFWPFNIHYILSGNPALIPDSLFEPRFLFSLIIIISCLAIAVKTRKSSREASFSLFWFFITLIPVANIYPLKNFMAVRYLYIPVAGFCFLIPVLLHKLHSGRFFGAAPDWLRNSGSAIPAVILSVCFVITAGTNRVWKDGVSFWSNVVKNYPDSSLAYKNLGLSLLKSGSADAAMAETKKSLELKPQDGEARRILGQCYLFKEMPEEAIFEFNESLRLEGGSAGLFNDLGIAYAFIGNLEEAKRMWLKALEINPGHEKVKVNLEAIERLK